MRIVNMSRRDVVKGIGGMTGLVLGFHTTFAALTTSSQAIRSAAIANTTSASFRPTSSS
jgi:hypothetical protein